MTRARCEPRTVAMLSAAVLLAGSTQAQTAGVSAACRIADLDFSKTGTLRIAGPAGATTNNVLGTDVNSDGLGGWSVSVCTPTNQVCPLLAKAFVETATCTSNASDAYSQPSSFVRTSSGVEFNFTTSGGAMATVNIACDATMPRDILAVAPGGTDALPLTTRGNTTVPLRFRLTSRCACPGGCGVASDAKANAECGIAGIDMSSVEALTWSADGGSDGLWQFSPCGATGAVCSDTPSYLASQSNAGTCNGQTLFTSLLAVAVLPRDSGLVLTYGGDGVGAAVVTVRCDPNASRFTATSLTSEPQASGYGNDARWAFNFSSRCACPGMCPSDRDFWAVGPGQRSVSVGKSVDYPVGYYGRTVMPDGSTVGKGIGLTQCKEACDATAPVCTTYTYSQPENGTCLLYATASCDTGTSPGWNWTTFYLENGGTCPPLGPMERLKRQRSRVRRGVDLHINRDRDAVGKAAVAMKHIVSAAGSARACAVTNGSCVASRVVGSIDAITSAQACCTLCGADPNCAAFTLLHNTSTCLLQTAGSPSGHDPMCSSGSLGPAPPPSPPSPPPSPPTPPPTADNCSAAGMHFGGLPTAVKFILPYAHDTDAWTEPLSWQLSLCTAVPSGCGGGPVHLIAGTPDCKSPPALSFPTLENFTVAADGTDFLLSGPQGLAKVSVVCDANAMSPYQLSPSLTTVAVTGNGSSPQLFLQVTMQSRCACPGLCGPKADPPPVAAGCVADGKNFSATAPAIFTLTANQTNGWHGGKPVTAPVGLRGDAPYLWTLSPCLATDMSCASPALLSARPQNATWCSRPLVALDRLVYIATRKNFASFAFASSLPGNSDVAHVFVTCGPGTKRFVPDAGMNEVVVTTLPGTSSRTYWINLTSSCACDGSCVPQVTRPYHGPGDGQSAISPGEHVPYPSDLPGASVFNGTTCGRGISRDQCAQACDAVLPPGCDSFSYDTNTMLCFLYRGGQCDTYPTPGTETEWISSRCPPAQTRVRGRAL